MSLATQNDIRCAIDEALKTAQHTHVVNASAYNPTTHSFSLVLSDGSTIDVDLAGVIADTLAQVKDKHIVAWTDYDPATNTGQLLMSDGTKVPVDLSAVIADAIASIVFPEVPNGLDCEAVGKLPERTYKAGDSVMVHGTDGLCARVVFPEVPKGLDCEAVGKLPERTYKAGDSVMVHGTDGLCARVVAKPGIFTDVRVGVVARSGSVFTNTSTDIITTIQNLAAGVATVRVDLTNPTGSGYELGIAAIEKPDAATVTKLTDTTYTISGLGQGDKVIISRPFKASVKGNYGFSATITVAEDNAFDYSTVDDYAGTNIYVSDASTGTPTVSCPLVKLYSPDGETELPVSEYPSYTPTRATGFYAGDPLKSFVVITEDTGYVDLPIEGATTAIAHVRETQVDQQSVGTPILALNNDKVVQFYGNSPSVSSGEPDPVGIVLDVANKKLRIPAPPKSNNMYIAAIELKAGSTCTPQFAVIVVARRSSLEITPGVVEITPTTGVTVGYDNLYGADMTTGMYTMDKDGIVGRSRITTAVKTATLTVPHGTPYTGVAKLSGISTTLSTTGNVTLKGYTAPAGDGIDITVSASAIAKDTVKDFATVLSVITSD